MAQPASQEWIGGTWFVMPQEPRIGTVAGVIRRVQTRTWAGCNFIHGEESRYPSVPVLDRGGVFAPLMRPPVDAAVRATMVREVEAWRSRSGYVGAGPPYAANQSPWLDVGANSSDAVRSVRGFWYPAFQAGTYAGFQIWGLAVDAFDG